MDSTAIGNYIALFSLIVAVISLTYTWHVNQAQNELMAQYKCSIIDWYGRTLAVIKNIEAGLRSGDEYVKESDLSQLSALIDYGRLFFPNIVSTNEKVGDDLSAFVGKRQDVLDYLVAIYDTGSKYEIPTFSGREEFGEDLAGYVGDQERCFVTEVYKLLEVQKMNKK